MSSALVSIIVNCHNGEKYLHESLSSVINQSHKNWELIFFDNLSTDKSKKILEGFNDSRIKYFKTEKFVSLYEARNLAVKKCSGDFISFLDTDDVWFKNRIEQQIKFYDKNKVYNFIFSNHYIYDEEKKTEKLYIKKKLLNGNMTQELLNNYKVGLLTILVKKELFKNNHFNPTYNIIGDFDFVLKLSLSTKFAYIDEPLAKYRRHNKNFSKIHFSSYVSEIKNWLMENKKFYSEKGYSLLGQQILLRKLQIKIFFGSSKF